MNQDNGHPLLNPHFPQLPLSRKDRKCTDVCCLVIGLLFSIVLIASSAVVLKTSTVYSAMYPADSSGNLCGHDLPAHPYLLFTSPPLIAARVCVSKCPVKGDTTTQCHPNSVVTNCSVSPSSPATSTFPEKTPFGDFCWPTDSTLTASLKVSSNLKSRFDVLNSVSGILITLGGSLTFAIIYMILVQCWPQFYNYILLPSVSVVMIFVINLVKGFLTNQLQIREVIFISLIVVAVVMVISVFKNCRSTRMHAIFTKAATHVVSQRKSLFFYILLYLLFLVLFLKLVMFQSIAFWSNGTTVLHPDTNIYYEVKSSPFAAAICVVLFVQFIWGVFFIKQSLNFCLSGNAIQWYFDQSENEKQGCCSSFCLQISKHFGSVIACAFMSGFFTIFDYFFDMIRPANQDCCYYKYFNCLFGWLKCLGSLIRPDALTIVAVNGSSYSNSAKFCEYLTGKAPLTEYYQFSSRLFSLATHALIISLSIAFAIYFPKVRSIESIVIVIINAWTISTCFISFYPDIAQSVFILYLLDQECLVKEKDNYQLQGQSQGVAHYRTGLAIELQAVFFEEDVKLS